MSRDLMAAAPVLKRWCYRVLFGVVPRVPMPAFALLPGLWVC